MKINSYPMIDDRTFVCKFNRFLWDFGFTLLEVMVAVSIISITLVAVYRMHAQTISMNSDARFYITAPLLAQKKLSDLEMNSMSDSISDAGNFEDEYPGFTWRISINEVESEFLGNIAEDLKKVDVTIRFNEGEFEYNLSSYKFLRE